MPARKPRKPPDLACIEAGRNHLEGKPPGLNKGPHQLLQAPAAQPIATRVGQDRAAAGAPNPVHRDTDIRPLHRHMARRPPHQEPLERPRPVRGMAAGHKPVGDVNATDDPRPLQNRLRPPKARRRQGLNHRPAALKACLAQIFQGLTQLRIGAIDPEPHHMHRHPSRPGHRQLHAGNELDAVDMSRAGRLVDTGHGIVIGQGQDPHAGGAGVRDQRRRLEIPVRPDCVRMQIVVQFCHLLVDEAPMIPIIAPDDAVTRLHRIQAMLVAASRPHAAARPHNDPGTLIGTLEQFFAMLAGLDHRYGTKAPLPDGDATRLGNSGLMTLAELTEISQQLGLPKAKAELERLAVSIGDWITRHHGEIHTLEPIVNGLAVMANEVQEPAVLEDMTAFMGDLMRATARDIATDPDMSDDRRPWRILQLNRAIVATRSHNTELMSQVFDDLIQNLPADARDFFREGMRQMEAVPYPARVRAVMTRYFQALAQHSLH